MDFDLARANMINCQMLPNQVTDDRVIAVMETLPREAFVPKTKQSLAYSDSIIAIGNNRYQMEPLVTARMLQALELKSTDVALSIGCGSGYAVAAMAKIVDTVVSVESDKTLASNAIKILGENNIDNLVVVEGELLEGYPNQAPYDVIFFDGGVFEIPPQIENQLGENGRAIAVVLESGKIGKLKLFKKIHGIVSSVNLFEVSTPLLPGFAVKERFSFNF